MIWTPKNGVPPGGVKAAYFAGFIPLCPLFGLKSDDFIPLTAFLRTPLPVQRLYGINPGGGTQTTVWGL